MDLEDAPQKSQRQSFRLPAVTPVTKAMAPLLPPQPAPPHEPRTPVRPAIRSTDKGDG